MPLLAFLPSGSEWFWILLVALLLFGPKKLPELARSLGKSMNEFKRAKNDLEHEWHKTVNEVAEKETVATASTPNPAAPVSAQPLELSESKAAPSSQS